MVKYIPVLDRLKDLQGRGVPELRFQADCAQQSAMATIDILTHHVERLGPHELRDGKPFWAKDLYQVTFDGVFESATLLVPEDANESSVKRALDAYLWDIGRTDHSLSRSEWNACKDAGRKHAEGIEMEVPRMPPEKLRAFVMDYIAGTIYTDQDVHPSSMGMVFMPILFGALSPREPNEEEKTPGDDAWQRLQTLPYPDPGKQPEDGGPPAKPEEPDLPEEPEAPTPPEPVKPDPVELERLDRAIEWVRVDAKAKDEYLAKIEAQNQKILAAYMAGPRAAWQAQHDAWETECKAIKASNRQAHTEYKQALKQWKAGQGELRRKQEAWKADKERHDACHAGFQEQRLRDLGCVWESVQTGTMCPGRSLNGYPIFYSCHVMHKDDLARVRVAIQREAERQKEIEV